MVKFFNPFYRLASHRQVEELKELVMATAQDNATRIANQGLKIDKIMSETRTLITKVSDLTAALAAAGDQGPEVTAALDATDAQLQIVDDLVPDPVEPGTQATGETSEEHTAEAGPEAMKTAQRKR